MNPKNRTKKEKKNKIVVSSVTWIIPWLVLMRAQWSSGRGGAGNIHKSDNKNRTTISFVKADIIKPRKELEVETARNRVRAFF
jgi:hypothetical protein